MLLDTTFFIDLEKELAGVGSRPCAAFLRARRHRPKYVSVPTLGEFAVEADARTTLKFFRGYQLLAPGRELAIFAGRLPRRPAGRGRQWLPPPPGGPQLPRRRLVLPPAP
ncbi:MAG TPA: hypothetical protein VHC86_16515 [Opitutaceae bacterium]|nr:hypothetical protein [Opitutaceae bacterium]